MIFVTVGNANQRFQRLLDTIDRLAQQGFFEGERLLVQCGNNPEFHSSHSIQQDFFTLDQFAETIRGASLVISHGGAGTLLHALSAGKVPVVMPRRKQYSEHVDDHQVELVRELATEGRVIPAYELDDLPAAITEARRRNVQQAPHPPSRMISLVSQAIEELIRHNV